MKLSLEFLEHCSAETGFQVAVLEKVTRMGEIAGHIASHPTLGEVPVLMRNVAPNLTTLVPQAWDVIVGDLATSGIVLCTRIPV